MLARYVPLMRLFIVVLVLALIVMFALFAQLVLSGGKPDAPRTEAERAVFAAEEAVKSNPEDFAARVKLSAAYLEAGSSSKAEEQAALAVRLAPADPTGYYSLGLAQDASGKTAEAMQNLEKAAATEGQLAQFYQDAYVAIARVKNREGKTKEALEAFDKAITYGPENAVLLYERGRMYEENQNWVAALEDYRGASTFVPDYEDAVAAYTTLAAAHPEAVEEMQKRQATDEATETAGAEQQ